MAHFISITFRCLWVLWGFWAGCGLLLAEEKPPKPKIDISGYGFVGNRELKNLLKMLERKDRPPSFYEPNFVEDAVLILTSRLHRDGYLASKIVAELTLTNGDRTSFTFSRPPFEPLPRPMQIKAIRFHIEEGILFYFDRLVISGLTVMSEKEARGFFIERGALLPLKHTRKFTQERLEQGLAGLTEVLERQGFETARVRAVAVEKNDRTGAVNAEIRVEEGLPAFVRSVREEISPAENAPATNIILRKFYEPYSRLWLQDYAQSVRTSYYHRGFPDVTIQTVPTRRETNSTGVELDLLSRIVPGPAIQTGHIRFEGHKRTRTSVLESRIPLDPGQPLDRVKAEQGRYSLSRLGVFDSVELRYEEISENQRDLIYALEEGKQFDLSVLAGYGSYERLRAGLEWEQFNLFGRAHHSRLRGVQSFKSSSVEYQYTIPEVIWEDVDLFLNSSWLRREEVSFTREEFGGGAGARTLIPAMQSEVSLRYNYQILNAEDADFTFLEGVPNAAVGAIIADLRHDRRDNPLYPRRGYKIFGTLETASQYLAGDVNYQRFEFSGAYHLPLDPGRWIHFGLSHGVVSTVAGPEEDLPFNRRFFPGGESSVRGYQQGEAAPRRRGRIVGAETYVIGNLEFEQALTPNWSLVSFIDGIGFAHRLRGYPFEEGLFSAGAGIRWKTMIGPIRLEYGHNLNPRQGDPSGTLHFSIGFPF